MHSTPHPIVFTLLRGRWLFFLSLFHQIPKFLSQYSDFCPLNRIAPLCCISAIFLLTDFHTLLYSYLSVCNRCTIRTGNPLANWKLFVAIADLISRQKIFHQGRTGTEYTGIGRAPFKIAVCIVFEPNLCFLEYFLWYIKYFFQIFLSTRSVFRPTSLGEDIARLRFHRNSFYVHLLHEKMHSFRQTVKEGERPPHPLIRILFAHSWSSDSQGYCTHNR
jgi:hypothetical protein